MLKKATAGLFLACTCRHSRLVCSASTDIWASNITLRNSKVVNCGKCSSGLPPLPPPPPTPPPTVAANPLLQYNLIGPRGGVQHRGAFLLLGRVPAGGEPRRRGRPRCSGAVEGAAGGWGCSGRLCCCRVLANSCPTPPSEPLLPHAPHIGHAGCAGAAPRRHS